MTAGRLDQAMKTAGVPCEGVSVGDPTDRATWSVQFLPAATAEQQALAAAIIAAIDIDDPAPVAVLTKYQFLGLLTLAERITLRTAAKTDPVLEDALAMMEMAQEIRGDDPLLAQMFGYCVTEEYVTAERAAELLAQIASYVAPA